MNDYKQQRYNRKKQYSRISLGIHQLIQYPIINLVWLILIAVIFALMYGKGKIMSLYNGQSILKQVMAIVMSIVCTVIPLIFALGIFDFVGEMTARRDEADMCLVFGDKRDVINQPPILIKKKYDKKNQTTQREFYTSIPMERWVEKRNAICDRLNIHLIGDFSYGGKFKNKGNQIYFESARGRKPSKRGMLYDDTF